MTKPAADARPTLRDRIVELRRVRAGDLIANPRNWRRHPESQRKALRAMLEDVGFAGAALARETPDGLELIDGHLRADIEPDATVPVLVLDVDEAEAGKLLATFDPLGSMAIADQDVLGELLGEIDLPGEAELGHLVQFIAGSARHRGLVDPDEIPPEPESVETEVGDLWVCGDHRLACIDATDADALEALVDGAQIDCLWTDPPYGVAVEGRTSERLRIVNDDLPASDLRALLGTVFTHVVDLLAAGATFYICSPGRGAEMLAFLLAINDAGLEVRQQIVWVKDKLVMGRGDYQWRHETLLAGHEGSVPATWSADPSTDWIWEHEALIYGWITGTHVYNGDRRQTTVWAVDRPSIIADAQLHPTVKPVELIARGLALSTKPDAVVLDPFMGSGSTMIAAQQLKRVAIGCDLSPMYVERAVRRWEAFTGLEAQRSRLA